MLKGVPNHAIVIGAGIAGLCAACVLAEHVEAVTVVERDTDLGTPGPRRSVPQGAHPHLLLGAGQTILESLVPGFCTMLTNRGAPVVDWSRDLYYWDAGGQIAGGIEPIPMIAASRPLLEQCLRTRIAALDAVTVRQNTHVTNYVFESGRIAGVRLRTANNQANVLSADLTVDASGRTSQTPKRLEEAGFPRPTLDTAHVDVTYSTIRIDRPPEDKRMIFVPPSPPRTLGGGAFPIEENAWFVTLQGMHETEPPTDPTAFPATAATLPTDALSEILADQSLPSESATVHPFPASRWHRFDGLSRFPDGLIVIGDAMASVNPIYGQGMSIAALQASALDTALETNPTRLPWAYFERAVEPVANAWRLAVGNDFRFTETQGSRPIGTAILNAYVERLLKRAHTDETLATAFVRAAMLERPLTSLVHPRIMWKVLRPTFP